MFRESVQQRSWSLDDKNSCFAYLFQTVGKFLASNVHPALRHYLSEELSECLDGKRPATVFASLFGIANASTHFEIAPTQVSMYFEPLEFVGEDQ